MLQLQRSRMFIDNERCSKTGENFGELANYKHFVPPGLLGTVRNFVRKTRICGPRLPNAPEVSPISSASATQSATDTRLSDKCAQSPFENRSRCPVYNSV